MVSKDTVVYMATVRDYDILPVIACRCFTKQYCVLCLSKYQCTSRDFSSYFAGLNFTIFLKGILYSQFYNHRWKRSKIFVQFV